MKKLNYNDVKKYVESIGYNLIDKTYINARIKLVFTDHEGYFLSSSFDNLKHGYIPMRFHKNNPYTIKNIKLWLIINDKPFILLSDKYINSNELLKWKCLKPTCGDTFNLSWECVFSNVGCGVCHGKQVGLSNCFATRKSHLINEWHPTKNILTPYDITSDSREEIWFKCPECGNEWLTTAKSKNTKLCPDCNKSQGEKECKRFLDIRNLFYIPQKKFEGLIGTGGGLLSYDFYLPQYNLLIEYQGQFHDGTAFQQNKNDIEKQVEHDRRKKEYALRNGYDLLEIWYLNYDNIEEILDNYLSLKKVV